MSLCVCVCVRAYVCMHSRVFYWAYWILFIQVTLWISVRELQNLKMTTMNKPFVKKVAVLKPSVQQRARMLLNHFQLLNNHVHSEVSTVIDTGLVCGRVRLPLSLLAS